MSEPMDGGEFLSNVQAWIDGELADEDAARMEAFAASSPEHAHFAEQERALQRRVTRALLSGVDAEATVAAMLVAARPASAPTGNGNARTGSDVGRAIRPVAVLRWLRPLTGVAAAALIALSMGWFFCIGPFDCQFLEALERGAEGGEVVAAAELAPALASIGDVPHPYTPCVGPGVVPVGYGDVAKAVRYCYVLPGYGDLRVLWCDATGERPSLRRLQTVDGLEWWVRDTGDLTMVAFLDSKRDLLCCLVGDQTEEELLDLAAKLRLAVR